jgi:hypothetical protein
MPVFQPVITSSIIYAPWDVQSWQTVRHDAVYATIFPWISKSVSNISIPVTKECKKPVSKYLRLWYREFDYRTAYGALAHVLVVTWEDPIWNPAYKTSTNGYSRDPEPRTCRSKVSVQLTYSLQSGQGWPTALLEKPNGCSAVKNIWRLLLQPQVDQRLNKKPLDRLNREESSHSHLIS